MSSGSLYNHQKHCWRVFRSSAGSGSKCFTACESRVENFRLDLSEVSVGPVKFNSNELKLIRSGLWRSWAANQTLPHLEIPGALFERLEEHRKFFRKLNS